MSKLPPKRLGRGLSGLLSITDEPAAPEPVAADVPRGARLGPEAGTAGTPLLVSPDNVHPNPHQPRKSFDDRTLAELAESVRQHGVLQPLVVKPRGAGGWELIAGERRLRAARLAGLAEVPVIVRDADELAQAQLALVENVQREDLNPIDRADGYRSLLGQLGLTQAELAARLGEDRGTISNHVRLLELPEPIRALVRDGKLPLGHAKVIGGVADPKEQARLADLVVSQELSVRNLERILQTPAVAPPKPKKGSDAHQREVEQSIAHQVGLRVQLRSGPKKGRGSVVLHYASLDEFDDLMERLGVELDKD